MKSSILIITLALSITSCETQKKFIVCGCEEKDNVDHYVREILRHSKQDNCDDFGDSVYESFRTGIKIHCHHEVFWSNSAGYIEWDKSRALDSCESVYRDRITY